MWRTVYFQKQKKQSFHKYLNLATLKTGTNEGKIKKSNVLHLLENTSGLHKTNKLLFLSDPYHGVKQAKVF